MAKYEIVPVLNGVFLEMERSLQSFGVGYGVKIKTPVPVFLIRGEGRLVLVDTGIADAETSLREHFFAVAQTEEMRLVPALARHGVRPEDVDFVVNTHLHWDHVYENVLFRGKKIFVQRREIEAAENPLPTFYRTYGSERVGLSPRWKLNRESLEAVDGDGDVAPGIRLVLLPGHTSGSQGVVVDTAAGKYLIAGDFIGNMANWRGNRDYKRIAPGMSVNLADCFASYDKVETLDVDDRILPGHDPALFDYPVYPPPPGAKAVRDSFWEDKSGNTDSR